jgi:hypothetical protein
LQYFAGVLQACGNVVVRNTGVVPQNVRFTPDELSHRAVAQLSTGEGLVATAVAIAGLWCVYAVPAYLDMNPNM